MGPCPSPERLQQLLADALDGPEAEAVEAHLEECAACQQAMERLMGAAPGAARGPGLPTESFHEKGDGEDFLRRLEAEPPAEVRTTTPQRDRAKILPKLAAGPRSVSELQTLLRKRLLFIAAVAWTALAVTSVAYLPLFGDVFTVSFFLLVVGVVSVVVVLLWRCRPLSLAPLRLLEVILFASMGVLFTVSQLLFHSWGWLARLAAHDWQGVWLIANAFSFFWFAIIVLYGIMIPNTWLRCAAVVGGMAVWSVLLSATAGLWDVPITPYLYGLFVIQDAINMGLAASLAIYGAHRIETLRKQASQARKLGPYQLKRRLGAGGMGEVYLAEHSLLRRPCAVKLIRAERAGDSQFLRRFEREVQAMATLSHPNTVEVFDYGHADDGTFYYVMEYLPGLTLEELVKQNGPLPPERAIGLLRQVCGALREAHGKGLIHRDVKPSNVLVCERGGVHDVAKLLDFGLVRAHGPGADAEKLTQEGMIAGTPAFMSPEQAAGRVNPDARGDIYSLGAAAYFLLTGQPPFVRDTTVQTLAAHLGEPVPDPSRLRADIPSDLREVVLRCLEKDPARRFPTIDALDQALAHCACADGWTRERAADWWQTLSKRT